MRPSASYHDDLPLPAGSRSKTDRKLIVRSFQGGKNDNRAHTRVAEVFVARNIGAVMVVDDQGSIIGSLSERDIVRALAKRGASASMNTRRCENISRPLEVPGIRLWRPEARWRKEPSNIQAFIA
jgi:predicted transcriptional regulator